MREYVSSRYSANGAAWNYLPHDHARSRAYRWGEDGIAGFSDRYQILSALNGLRERLTDKDNLTANAWWTRPTPGRVHPIGSPPCRTNRR